MSSSNWARSALGSTPRRSGRRGGGMVGSFAAFDVCHSRAARSEALPFAVCARQGCCLDRRLQGVAPGLSLKREGLVSAALGGVTGVMICACERRTPIDRPLLFRPCLSMRRIPQYFASIRSSVALSSHVLSPEDVTRTRTCHQLSGGVLSTGAARNGLRWEGRHRRGGGSQRHSSFGQRPSPTTAAGRTRWGAGDLARHIGLPNAFVARLAR